MGKVYKHDWINGMRTKRFRASDDELARIAARKEAREKGFEYRPTTAAQSAEAERLNRGLSAMEEDDINEVDQD